LSAKAASASQVNLAWQPVSGAASYDIYRGAASSTSAVKLASVTGTAKSFGDSSGLQANTTYSYSIVARDAAGNSSPSSDAVTVTTPGSTPTPGPTQGTGTLIGKVRNSKGQPIKSAKVTLKIGAKSASATTGSDGSYRLNSQPVGSYSITYSASGYKTSNDHVSIVSNVVKTKNKTLSR
jgi:hypothetical protein